MVEAVLNEELPQAPFRIIAVKFVGGVLAIGSGLALSREGPSVQSPDRGDHRAGLFFGQLCQLVFPRGLWRTPPVPSGEAQFQNWRVSKVPCDHRIDGGDDCLSVLTPSQISALVEPLDRVFIEHASKQSAHNSPRVVQVAAIQEPAPDCVLYGCAYTATVSSNVLWNAADVLLHHVARWQLLSDGGSLLVPVLRLFQLLLRAMNCADRNARLNRYSAQAHASRQQWRNFGSSDKFNVARSRRCKSVGVGAGLDAS